MNEWNEIHLDFQQMTTINFHENCLKKKYFAVQSMAWKLLTRGLNTLFRWCCECELNCWTLNVENIWTKNRVTHIICVSVSLSLCVCVYVAAKLSHYTIRWIMGDVVNVDQFESVTIFDRCYEYGHIRHLYIAFSLSLSRWSSVFII